MVALPLEIIQHVISIALPDLSFDNHLRSDFLISFCHLHPFLTRYAQTRLFNHPVLRRPEAIKSFLEAVEADDELRKSVKSLRVGSSVGFVMGDDSNAALARICAMCEAVEEVWLNGLSNVDFAAFPRAKNLKRLSCSALVDAWVDYEGERPASMETLEHLSFERMSLGSLMDDWFFRSDFPALTRMRLADLDDISAHPWYVSELDELYDFTGQLRHLAVNNVGGDSSLHYIYQCQRLLSLTLDFWDDPNYDSPFDTPPLVALRLRYTSTAPIATLVTTLRAMYATNLIDSSTVVFVPDVAEMNSIAGSGDVRDWSESIGVRVEYADGAIEQSWAGRQFGGKDDFSEFADWVNEEVVRRAVLEREREEILER